jgi:hypothetical protein
MILANSLLATEALVSPTKKRTLFSRLPLSEPTISTLFEGAFGPVIHGTGLYN